MKRDAINCLRCKTPMVFLGEQQIQMGKTSWVLGDLPNLFAGAMDVEVYQCRKCGKLEFFSMEGNETQCQEAASRKICPECSAEHDADDDCCPICGYVYTK